MRTFTFISVVGFSTLLLFSACSEKRELSEMPVYDGPMLVATNVNTVMTDSAIARIHLTAPLQHQDQQGDRDFPKGLHMDFKERDGHTSSTVDAEQGHFFQEKNLWKVTGNVVLEGLDEGERLTTEELWWDPSKKEVYTEDDVVVTIRQGNSVITGTGLWALQDFSEYSLQDITGEHDIEEESEETE